MQCMQSYDEILILKKYLFIKGRNTICSVPRIFQTGFLQQCQNKLTTYNSKLFTVYCLVFLPRLFLSIFVLYFSNLSLLLHMLVHMPYFLSRGSTSPSSRIFAEIPPRVSSGSLDSVCLPIKCCLAYPLGVCPFHKTGLCLPLRSPSSHKPL